MLKALYGASRKTWSVPGFPLYGASRERRKTKKTAGAVFFDGAWIRRKRGLSPFLKRGAGQGAAAGIAAAGGWWSERAVKIFSPMRSIRRFPKGKRPPERSSSMLPGQEIESHPFFLSFQLLHLRQILRRDSVAARYCPSTLSARNAGHRIDNVLSIHVGRSGSLHNYSNRTCSGRGAGGRH